MESILKAILTVNFSKLEREMDIWITEAQKTPGVLNPNKVHQDTLISKLLKVKEF